jgi:hypothetical protein
MEQHAPTEDERLAARLTCALPVYSDMGGMLLIDPEGDVLSYDPDSQEAERETDERWRRRAKAVAKHPELIDLMPLRPA